MALSEEALAFREAALSSLDTFAKRSFPSVEGEGANYQWNWHIDCVCEHLEAVWRGEIRRLIINIPPRTLKSFLVASCFPAWAMAHRKSTKFIMASNSQSLAEDHIVNCKNIMKDTWYRTHFPDTVIDSKHDARSDFRTTGRGRYYGAGILGTITGKGADIVLCDDPLKPHLALSDQIRTETNKAIRSTLFSRLNDPQEGRFIMIMQRLHENDPTGELLKDGGYHLLKLPAQAVEYPRIITLGEKHWVMKKDGLLFPDRFTPAVLEEKRNELLDYNYVGQYLQEPVPLGGGEFKSANANYTERETMRPREMNIYILCDPAGGEETKKKKKKRSDFTTFMVIGLAPDNNYYLLDAIRDRLNPTERIETLFELHRHWNNKTDRPPKVGYEQYGLMTDIHYIKELQKQTGYRFPVIKLAGKMAKEDRIRRMIPDFDAGRWWFPTSLVYRDYEHNEIDLVRELVKSEMAYFPRSQYDDMLDAMTRIYDADMKAQFPKLEKKNKTVTTETDNNESFMDY